MTRISPIGPGNARINSGLNANPSVQIRLTQAVKSLSHRLPIQISAAASLCGKSSITDALSHGLAPLLPFEEQRSRVGRISHGKYDLIQISLSGVPSPVIVSKGLALKSGIFQVVHMGEVKEGALEVEQRTNAAPPDFQLVDIKIESVVPESGHVEAEHVFSANIITPGLCIGRALKIVSSGHEKLADYPDENLSALAASKGMSLSDLANDRADEYEVAAAKVYELKEKEHENLKAECAQLKRDIEALSETGETPELKAEKERELAKKEYDGFSYISLMQMIKESREAIIRNMRENRISAATASKMFLAGQIKRMQDTGTYLLLRQAMVDLEDTFVEILHMKHGTHIDANTAINSSGFGQVVLFAQGARVVTALFNPVLTGVFKTEGSLGGHEPIYARANGKLYCLGSEADMRSVNNGDVIIMDSTENMVFCNPSEATMRAGLAKKAVIDHAKEGFRKLRGRDIISPVTGRPVRFYVNAMTKEEVKDAFSGAGRIPLKGAEGIGLVRTEEFFGKTIDSADIHERIAEPSIPDQVAYYDSLVEYSGPDGDSFPVTVRTIDINARHSSDPDKAMDKELPYVKPAVDNPKEADGLPLCLNQDTPMYLIFRNQAEALLRSKVKYVMFPGVRNKEQYFRALEIFDEVASDLRARNVEINGDKVFGLMVECEDIFTDIEDLMKSGRVAFASVGTNDLTSSITGVARDSKVQRKYRAQIFSSRVGQRLSMLKALSDKYGVPLRVCGDHVNDWPTQLFLLSMGYDGFSYSNTFEADIARAVTSITDAEGLRRLLRILEQIPSQYEKGNTIANYLYEMARTKQWPIDDQSLEFLKIWAAKGS